MPDFSSMNINSSSKGVTYIYIYIKSNFEFEKYLNSLPLKRKVLVNFEFQITIYKLNFGRYSNKWKTVLFVRQHIYIELMNFIIHVSSVCKSLIITSVIEYIVLKSYRSTSESKPFCFCMWHVLTHTYRVYLMRKARKYTRGKSYL